MRSFPTFEGQRPFPGMLRTATTGQTGRLRESHRAAGPLGCGIVMLRRCAATCPTSSRSTAVATTLLVNVKPARLLDRPAVAKGPAVGVHAGAIVGVMRCGATPIRSWLPPPAPLVQGQGIGRQGRRGVPDDRVWRCCRDCPGARNSRCEARGCRPRPGAARVMWTLRNTTGKVRSALLRAGESCTGSAGGVRSSGRCSRPRRAADRAARPHPRAPCRCPA